MQKSLVSLGLPVYNGEKYLAESLQSIVDQTYPHWELVISDNGSTDATERICRGFAARDGRIRYYRNPINRGAAWNHNRVVELSRGPFFRWAGYDDVCAPELLERCVPILENDARISLCYSRSTLIDENGKVLGRYEMRFATDSPSAHERFYDLISRDYLCNQFYGIIRMSILRKVPLLGNLIAADVHLLAELALHGAFFEVPEYLFFRRDHPLRSVKALPNPRDLLAWFNPQATAYRYIKLRRMSEYVKSIARAPLDAKEKILCYNCLGKWMFNRFLSKALKFSPA